jgi:O-Antigen ligase
MTRFVSTLPLMSVGPATSPRALFSIFGIVTLGVLTALATDVALSQLTPVKVLVLLGGFALLIPTVVMKHPKAYWLFLLALSIPFDISKWLSGWPVDSQSLVDLYGVPASGTSAIEPYLTDVVLVVMVLPWFARVAVRRETVYFPAIGYLYVLYLIWALLVSLLNAQSFYLALFELWRQAMYLLFFLYLINNITTRLELRSVIWAVFLGFIIGTGTVVVFFELGYGTATSIWKEQQPVPRTFGFKQSLQSNLTLENDKGRRGGKEGQLSESSLKRSQGMFRHPAMAASLCGLILPIVLAYLVAARRNRDRILLFMVFILGVAGLVLTFSKAGAISFAVGTIAFFAVGSWAGLISRRVLIGGLFAFTVAVVLSVPWLIIYFGSRPETFYMRFNMFQAALDGYLQHPFLGVGFNNATGAMNAGKNELRELGMRMPKYESAENLYLVVLTEVGPVGFILFFAFFGKLVLIALRAMRAAATDLKPLLVGVVAGFASLATQNLGDDTLGGHAINATLWLFVSLIVVIARDIQAETRFYPAGGHAAPIRPRFAARPLT